MSISNMVSDYVERFTGIKLSSQAITGDFQDGGNSLITATYGPVNGEITVYDMYTTTDVPAAFYYTAGDSVVAINAQWEQGLNRYKLSYTAGYSTIPDGLQEVITRIENEATALYATAGAGTFKSESMPNGYSYTIADAVSKAVQIHYETLQMYKRYI